MSRNSDNDTGPQTIHCVGLSANWKTISCHLCFYIWLSLCSILNVKSNLFFNVFYLHLFFLAAAGDASVVTNSVRVRNQVWSLTDVHCIWIRGVTLTHQNVSSCIFYVLDLTSILQLCTNSPSHKSVLMKWWNNDADSAESLSTGHVFPENNTLLTRTRTPVISIHLVPFSMCVTHGAFLAWSLSNTDTEAALWIIWVQKAINWVQEKSFVLFFNLGRIKNILP